MTVSLERRRGSRVAPEHTPWARAAILRPDQEVAIIDLSPGGALIESSLRMKPGARAELQLLGPSRWVLRGRIDRCRVVAIEPLQYEGAIIFDEPWESGRTGSEYLLPMPTTVSVLTREETTQYETSGRLA